MSKMPEKSGEQAYLSSLRRQFLGAKDGKEVVPKQMLFFFFSFHFALWTEGFFRVVPFHFPIVNPKESPAKVIKKIHNK